MKKVMRYISDEELIYNLNKVNNVSRGNLIQIHIADIHFGAIDPKTQYQILEEQFLNKIINIDFDLLSIDGDLFEHKYMSNSEAVMYATMFINRIVDICRTKQATFILLHGTNYHDAQQLKIFYHYLQDPTIDIRIVEEVRFEYVKGAKILCIPELYNKGKAYYEQFLYHSGQYDAVFMHGTLVKSIFGMDKPNLDSNREPVLSIDHFALCRGYIISGHVHTGGCFNGYFYYTGSPIRYAHGEENEKGFLVVLHNLDTHQHYVHLEPIKSFIYRSINLDHMLLQDPKDVIEYVNNLQSQGVDYVRIEFSTIDNEQAIANIELIKKYYKSNSYIKVKSQNIKTQNTMKVNEEALDKYKDYEYILDKSLSEEEILTRYINQNMGYKYITVEELQKILKEDF